MRPSDPSVPVGTWSITLHLDMPSFAPSKPPKRLWFACTGTCSWKSLKVIPCLEGSPQIPACYFLCHNPNHLQVQSKALRGCCWVVCGLHWHQCALAAWTQASNPRHRPHLRAQGSGAVALQMSLKSARKGNSLCCLLKDFFCTLTQSSLYFYFHPCTENNLVLPDLFSILQESQRLVRGS